MHAVPTCYAVHGLISSPTASCRVVLLVFFVRVSGVGANSVVCALCILHSAMALEATSLGMVVLDDLPTRVLTPGAALVERVRERDERIQKLKEKRAHMKDAALKRKLIAQRATKAQERKRMEREKTSITSYFRRGTSRRPHQRAPTYHGAQRNS
jgi:hypothetical protein